MYSAKEIKEGRAKLMLTQEELAEKLNVTKTSVTNWERGHHKMSIKVQREFKKLLEEI